MEQPKGLAGLQPPQPAPADETKQHKNNNLHPPSPEEILTFYESQGLDPRSASLKAIQDLQSALLRRSAASSRRNRLPPSGDLQRNLDNINTRLAVLQMKLDSKPGFPESLAIALSSGALLPGLSAAWRSVSSLTKSRTPP